MTLLTARGDSIGYSDPESMTNLDIIYVCPECKGSLQSLFCENCRKTYPAADGIPCFMSANASDSQIRQVYDEIYRHHTDVWIDQGRSEAFQEYFAHLVRGVPHERILEIGCGEGILLAALPGKIKFGIDPSLQALLRAHARSHARCSVARCEQLPFPGNAFDTVIAVGVMEHFANIDAAMSEVYRVLSASGHFITLIQTDMTRFQRVKLKFRQYVFPNFQPIAMMRWSSKWLNKRFIHPIVQPLRKSYTENSATHSLQRNGLSVVRVIRSDTEPAAPLAGPHVIILIAQKRAD